MGDCGGRELRQGRDHLPSERGERVEVVATVPRHKAVRRRGRWAAIGGTHWRRHGNGC